MPRFEPCANSRAPRRPAWRRLGSAPIRIATPLVVLLTLSSCTSPPSDTSALALAIDRYLAAVRGRDLPALDRLSTCRPPGPAFRGGTILRIEPLRLLSRGALDSLAFAAEESSRVAALDMRRADEDSADSLWLRAEAARRWARLIRDAQRASTLSREPDGTSPARREDPSNAMLRVGRARLRIRWGGPLVGPEAVDGEHVLRALAVPGGRWVVFSVLPRDRDLRGVPF